MDSNTAKKIKSKNTSIERLLGKAMWAAHLRYRKHCKDIFGNPDFCFRKKKIAIFCDSEFWHGKKYHNGEKFKKNDFVQHATEKAVGEFLRPVTPQTSISIRGPGPLSQPS